MSNINATVRARLVTPENPTIYNVLCPTVGVEYSLALALDTKKFSIKSRESCTLKLSYQAGQSGITFLTIPRGAVYSEDTLTFNGSLYFQADRAGVTVEIVQWV